MKYRLTSYSYLYFFINFPRMDLSSLKFYQRKIRIGLFHVPSTRYHDVFDLRLWFNAQTVTKATANLLFCSKS